jgi:hypothetical protein
MLGKAAAAGLAGLGLIGGAGTVIYHNNGDATVKIKNDKTGQVQSVLIRGAGGKSYSCPSGTREKLNPYVIAGGRIKLTLRQVRRQESAIMKRYPNHRAPDSVVVRYKAIARREGRLVAAYNAQADAQNAILDRDCTTG